ncbi:Predicted arabinose efflux permease, MFS family [Chitinophaga eiseniae]|uniref:Predicted arabinose efflux permease, MFS family n=1 Tax=Chitinophaga eiseniae TaxID=634771 RepID=A0A1T4T6W4_9BACT|nr:MFS transporter [Chitinophaga eiseniae]SKA36157.1 Predicted arabinose efflux permease, MFS family [Chitinophaga eiseniae]
MGVIIKHDIGTSPSASFSALVTPVVLSVLSIFLTIGVSYAVLPALVHEQLGYGNVMVGVVLGLANATALITRMYAGTHTDTRGPRSGVIRGILTTAVAGLVYVCSAITGLPPMLSLGLLLAARILHGIGESFLITGALTLGIGLAGPGRAGKLMAWVGISLYAGIGLGAPIGNFVLQHMGIVAAFVLIILLPVLGSLPVLKCPEITPGGKKSGVPFYKVVSLISRQGISLALSVTGFGCISSFVALMFTANQWSGAAWALSIFAATYTLVRLFFASSADKYGGYLIAVISVVIEIAGLLILCSAGTPAVALVGCALTGAGFSLIFPALGVEAVKKVSPEIRGSAMGAYTAFTDLALGITGPVAGLIASSFGYQAVYLFGAVSAALALLLIMIGKEQ